MSTSKKNNQHYGDNELKSDIACIDRVQKIIIETSKAKCFPGKEDLALDREQRLIADLDRLKLEVALSTLTRLDGIGTKV